MKIYTEMVGDTLDTNFIVQISRGEMMDKISSAVIEQAVHLAAVEISKEIVKKYGKKIAKKVAISDVYSLCRPHVL